MNGAMTRNPPQSADATRVATLKARLEPSVRAFAFAVQARLRDANVTTHLLSTASFPWWAVVSICCGADEREELLVLDLAYWRNAERCQLSCDLSTGGGAVLDELPEAAVAAADLTEEGLDGWIDRAQGFVGALVETAVRFAQQRAPK